MSRPRSSEISVGGLRMYRTEPIPTVLQGTEKRAVRMSQNHVGHLASFHPRGGYPSRSERLP